MTPGFPAAQDSPLSLQGEGWGEGALNPNSAATGKPHSRASPLPSPQTQKKAAPGGLFHNAKPQRFSAAARSPFRVFIGASTTKLLASHDGMLPPGSVCTW